MSTRSATIIRQTECWGDEDVETKELMRFYRHCDGYLTGHGMDMAHAVINADLSQWRSSRHWLANFLDWFLKHDPFTTDIEFEPVGCEHGDLEFLYIIEGVMDYRGQQSGGRMPVTISVYDIGWDEKYSDAQKRDPVFTGTAYEYVEKFGKEQQ